MSDTLREDILLSEAGQRMVDRVSPIYDNSYVGLWLFESIGREFDTFWDAVLSLESELFPEYTTWLIDLWERRYGIKPPSGATLVDRRRTLARAQMPPQPFNPRRLEEYIESIAFRTATVTENISPYKFRISIDCDNITLRALDLNAIRDYVNTHKPSHMSYVLNEERSTKMYCGLAVFKARELSVPLPAYDMADDYLVDEDGVMLVDHKSVVLFDVYEEAPELTAMTLAAMPTAETIFEQETETEAESGGEQGE